MQDNYIILRSSFQYKTKGQDVSAAPIKQIYKFCCDEACRGYTEVRCELF